jgi:ferrochelatase
VAQAESSGPDGGAYVAQHLDVAVGVADGVRRARGTAYPWWLVYQSRSGPPTEPWLEPDVNDQLAAMHADGVAGAVLVPIGFISDHMEVIFDLDTEAAATAADLSLPVARAATVDSDPVFVAALRDLVLERAAAERGEHPARPAVGRLGPSHDVCPADCCPNPLGPRPACCQEDDQEDTRGQRERP